MHGREEASVIIAAYNEEAVIERALDRLASSDHALDLEIIVVCNGCTDDTASLARSHGSAAVIEIVEASKVAALNVGDRAASAFPRLYLDADTEINIDALESTIKLLAAGGTLAARPASTHDLSGRSSIVSAYYRTRENLPSVVHNLWGAGIYGLSREGRQKFGEFPQYTADDLFVDRQFLRSEIVILSCEPVIVQVPYSTRALLRMLRRVYLGKEEQRAPTERRILTELIKYASSGVRGTVDALTYVFIVLWARALRKILRDERWGSGRAR